MKQRVVLGVVAALVLATSGCSVNARLRRSTDEAEAQHLAGLRTPAAAASYFVLPDGAAWNAALAALRRRPGVEAADPATGVIRATPRFETTLSDDSRLNVQTATVATVAMAATDTSRYSFQVSFASESRQRGVCEEASAWQPIAPRTFAGVDEVVNDAVRGRLASLTWSEVAFRPSDTFGDELATALLPYTIASNEGDTWTTAWRETTYEGRRVSVRTRSRLSIRRLVAVDGTSRFEVGAELEHQGDHEKETSTWTRGNASLVGAHAWAVLERVAAPFATTLPNEAREEVVSTVSVAPALEAPPEPGVGTYDFVFALTVPDHKLDGAPWDASEALVPSVQYSPGVMQMGQPIEPIRIPALASALLQSNPNLATDVRAAFFHARLERMLADAAAPRVRGAIAPDPFLDLDLAETSTNGSTGWVPFMQLPLVPNTGSAVWTPFRHPLVGQSIPVQWKAFDKDQQVDDPIAVGTVDLLEIVRSCTYVASAAPGGVELRAMAMRSTQP